MNQIANELNKYQREWLAELSLGFELRAEKTRLVENTHLGPLRVLKPYYPEDTGSCHIYLLHPPGGLVLGDRLNLNVSCGQGSEVLLTTPSAGKVYTTRGDPTLQQQHIQFDLAENSVTEWLPQETIIFSGANANLTTRFDLKPGAKIFAWDVVCLGRPAAGEDFAQGQCKQSLQVYRDGQPIFLEKNNFAADADLMRAKWGLNAASTTGTLIASVKSSRDQIDRLYQELERFDKQHCWGLTQRDEFFVARYIGPCAEVCRLGFEIIWQTLRPLLNQREALRPRIWNT